jgi:predicted nucleotidyltransferase
MMSIVTLPERKRREAARRADAARAVMERLRRFVDASGHRGRFIIFGSAAQHAMRHDSDFDVVIDFPEEEEKAAWRIVEDACEEADLPADILSTSTTAQEFVARIMKRSVEVIA